MLLHASTARTGTVHALCWASAQCRSGSPCTHMLQGMLGFAPGRDASGTARPAQVKAMGAELCCLPLILQLAIPGQDAPEYHVAYRETTQPSRWNTKGWSGIDDSVKPGRGTSTGKQYSSMAPPRWGGQPSGGPS